MEVEFVNTRVAAEMLGVSANTLSQAIFQNRIPRPPRVPGGRSFLWGKADLDRAREVMLLRQTPAQKIS